MSARLHWGVPLALGRRILNLRNTLPFGRPDRHAQQGTKTFGTANTNDYVQHEGKWVRVVRVKPRGTHTTLGLANGAYVSGEKRDPLTTIAA